MRKLVDSVQSVMCLMNLNSQLWLPIDTLLRWMVVLILIYLIFYAHAGLEIFPCPVLYGIIFTKLNLHINICMLWLCTSYLITTKFCICSSSISLWAYAKYCVQAGSQDIHQQACFCFSGIFQLSYWSSEDWQLTAQLQPCNQIENLVFILTHVLILINYNINGKIIHVMVDRTCWCNWSPNWISQLWEKGIL